MNQISSLDLIVQVVLFFFLVIGPMQLAFSGIVKKRIRSSKTQFVTGRPAQAIGWSMLVLGSVFLFAFASLWGPKLSPPQLSAAEIIERDLKEEERARIRLANEQDAERQARESAERAKDPAAYDRRQAVQDEEARQMAIQAQKEMDAEDLRKAQGQQ